MSTPSAPPPYSASEGNRQSAYAPYPSGPDGYPTPQMNVSYSGYPPPPSPGAYPPTGYQPPHGGYSQAPPGPGFYQPPATHQPVTVHTTTTTVVNNSPGDRCVGCTSGRIKKHFTAGGICCAIFCFPCGIICCLSSRVRSCDKCGAIYM